MSAMSDDSRSVSSNQCGVKGCKNTRDQGAFVGPFCAPCDHDLRTGNFEFGTSVVHEQAREIERLHTVLKGQQEATHENFLEIERLREENQALRNLANNLRPGPISQALQDSPDYSGQTIERLRAAMDGIRNYPGLPAVIYGVANSALSGDSQSCTCRKLPEPPSDDCPIHGQSQVEMNEKTVQTFEVWSVSTSGVEIATQRKGMRPTDMERYQPKIGDVFVLWSDYAAKQAKIDALMLEFSPGEMSAEQRAEWAKHQVSGDPSAPETTERQNYQESDGCPTELAVLQRFWREHHASGECAHDWKNVVNVETIKYGKRLKVCMKCGAERVGSVEEISVSVADYDAIDTTNPQPVPSPRFAGLTGEVRAPKAGDRCGHCGREWMPAPYGGQGVYHECHTGPSQQVKTSDECLAHNSGCHVRDGSGICPLCKQPVGPVEKASDSPVCSKCQTPMRLAQTDYGMGWQLDCACKDGGPAKRESDKVDCGNPVMINAERYGSCTLPSGHDGDCKRTTKETVPRSDESQHGKDCECGLCKHAHDL